MHLVCNPEAETTATEGHEDEFDILGGEGVGQPVQQVEHQSRGDNPGEKIKLKIKMTISTLNHPVIVF